MQYRIIAGGVTVARASNLKAARKARRIISRRYNRAGLGPQCVYIAGEAGQEAGK